MKRRPKFKNRMSGQLTKALVDQVNSSGEISALVKSNNRLMREVCRANPNIIKGEFDFLNEPVMKFNQMLEDDDIFILPYYVYFKLKERALIKDIDDQVLKFKGQAFCRYEIGIQIFQRFKEVVAHVSPKIHELSLVGLGRNRCTIHYDTGLFKMAMLFTPKQVRDEEMKFGDMTTTDDVISVEKLEFELNNLKGVN